MKKLLLLLIAVGAVAIAQAQTMRESIAADPDLAAGIYTAYRVTDQVQAFLYFPLWSSWLPLSDCS